MIRNLRGGPGVCSLQLCLAGGSGAKKTDTWINQRRVLLCKDGRGAGDEVLSGHVQRSYYGAEPCDLRWEGHSLQCAFLCEQRHLDHSESQLTELRMMGV